jgi:thioredoxin-like negative regulator of GroEL
MSIRILLAAIAAAAALLLSGPVAAQPSAWQKSYELEAAGQWADALAVIDAHEGDAAETEFKALRHAWLNHAMGNLAGSAREYGEIARRYPQSVDARLGLTLPLLAARRWREAEQAARAALELAPNHYTALLRLTLALEGQRDWPAMARTAAAWVAAYPSDALPPLYLARAQLAQGRRDGAASAYAAVLVRSPAQAEARAFFAKP